MLSEPLQVVTEIGTVLDKLDGEHVAAQAGLVSDGG
jgi:hypothetical protein